MAANSETHFEEKEIFLWRLEFPVDQHLELDDGC